MKNKLNAIIQAFDGLIYVCSQDYRVEFMNERLIERTGYDATGDTCYKVLHDRDSVCPWCVNDRVLRGETARWEIKSPKDNRWYYVMNSPICNADGTISKLAMIIDITERKLAEEAALRKSEDKYRELVENANSIILRRNTLGNITFINEFAQKFFGYSEEELLGRNVVGTIVPEVDSTGRDLTQMIMDIGKNPDRYINNINENMRRNGERAWIAWTNRPVTNDRGEITEILCIGNDITERKKTEDASRKAEREKTAIMDAMSELVLLLDTDMKIVWSNNAVSQQFNLEPRSLEGKHCFSALHGLKRHCKICPVVTVIETGEPYTIEQFSSFNKVWMLRAYPVKDENNNLTGIVEIVTDITERKKAEEALHQVLQYLQELELIVNKSTAIAFLWHASDGWPVEFISDNIIQFGYTPHDFMSGMIPFISIIHTDDRKRVATEVEQFTREGRTEFTQEYRILTKSGEVRWIDDRKWIRRDAEGNVTHYQGIVFDITERKQAEEELQRVNKTQSLILENSVMGIGFVRNRVFEWVNPQLPEMLGLPLNRVQGSNTRIIYSSDEIYEQTGRNAYEALGRGESYEFVIAMPHADGKTFIGRVIGKSLDPSNPQEGSIWLFENITERKRIEEALISAEQKYRDIFENAVMGIYQTTPEGQFISVNPAFARILGYDSPEGVLKSVTDISRQVYANPEWRTEFTEILEKHGTVKDFEVQFIRNDKTLAWINLNGRAVRNNEGEISYYEGTIQDITDRKLLESRLLQSQKMEAIGTLAGGIAHDFNNILSAIIGYTEITKGRLQQPELQHHLERVLEASCRARDLVAQILTFSRKAEREMTEVNVTSLIKESLKLLRATLPSTIEIRSNIVSTEGIILGDPTQIHQIVMNLCTNAAHAMRDEGGILEVGLTCEEITSEPSILYQDLTPGRFMKLTVSDTGTGIAPEIINRIFDPFFTTKKHGEGTGIGLSVVYGIVKECGGTVLVQSTPGAGSTFSVYLPAIEHEQEIKTELKAPIPGGSESILFIDDESVLAEMGQNILEGLGYTVVSSTNSIDALEMFHMHPHQFDLVITDMTMPGLTGKGLAEELMKIRPDIPIMLCTGYSDLITEEEAKNLGITEFIMKPISLREFSQAVRKVLDEKKSTKIHPL